MESDEADVAHLISIAEQKPVLWDKSLDNCKCRNLTIYVFGENNSMDCATTLKNL